MKKLLFLILTLLFVSCGETKTDGTNVLAGNSNYGVSQGNYLSKGFYIYNSGTEVKSQITLTSGTKVAFYIFSEAEYSKFIGAPTNNPAIPVSALSKTSVTSSFTSGWSTLPIGKYYVVVYNTGTGTARGSYTVTSR